MKFFIRLFICLYSAISYVQAESSFLSVEQAFAMHSSIENNELHIKFDTASGYYLYKKRLSIQSTSDTLMLGEHIYSEPATPKEDLTYGKVNIYAKPFSIRIAFTGQGQVKLRYQGCSDAGLCYLPQSRNIDVQTITSRANIAILNADSPQNILSSPLKNDATGLSLLLEESNIWQALLLFFVLGLGLALTPCVLPMIPILASILGGQKGKMSGWRGFKIALAYVLGMATSYACAGILTATLGQSMNLQAAMQQTWVLCLFALIFVGLALAMFGVYELQLPARLQTYLNSRSQKIKGGTTISIFIMGALAALVVSPCVSAPLAGALLYVSSTQDWMFGGLALFTMALGMGIPLLIIGTTGGKFLPKNGPWMVAVKQLFGVMLLAVGIVLVSRFSSDVVILSLWAALTLTLAIHYGALENAINARQRLRKAGAFVLLLYGIALFCGAMTGAHDPLDPLQNIYHKDDMPSFVTTPNKPLFTKVSTLIEIQENIKKSTTQQTNHDPRYFC